MMIYMFILLAKIVEVSIGTIRIVLITRGEKLLGACIGFVEVIIWLILVSTVLTNVSEDPVKVVIYAVGFAVGNYVGSMLEEKLAIGNIRLEAIVSKEDGETLVSNIRDKGYAVTVIDGRGMTLEREVLLMNIKRKHYNQVVDMIKRFQENVVITVNDVKPVYGGHGTLKR